MGVAHLYGTNDRLRHARNPAVRRSGQREDDGTAGPGRGAPRRRRRRPGRAGGLVHARRRPGGPRATGRATRHEPPRPPGERLHDAREGVRTAEPLAGRRRRRGGQGGVLRGVRHRVRGRVRRRRPSNRPLDDHRQQDHRHQPVAPADPPRRRRLVRRPLPVERREGPTAARHRPQRPGGQQVHPHLAQRRRPHRRPRGDPGLARLQGRARPGRVRGHARTGQAALAGPQRRLPRHRRVPGHHDAAVRRVRGVAPPRRRRADRRRRRPGRLLLAGRRPEPPAGRGRRRRRRAAELLPPAVERAERRQPRDQPHRRPPGQGPRTAHRGRHRRGRRTPLDARPRAERPRDRQRGRRHRDGAVPGALPDVPVHRRVHRRGHPVLDDDRPADVDRAAHRLPPTATSCSTPSTTARRNGTSRTSRR